MATTPPSFDPVTSGCDLEPNPQFAHQTPTGPYAPPPLNVGTLDYSTSECADHEADYIANLQAEALNIAGGPVNLFPMLGVHSQGSTTDMTGSGYPLSSGTPGGYNVLDAFNVNASSWRSVQTGSAVTSAPAYLGYSFGAKKAWAAVQPGGIDRYGNHAPVLKKVSSIKIKQGALAANRVRQVRVEASNDGVSWERVDVVNLPDTDLLVAIGIRSNSAFNQWRFVPTMFNAAGVTANEPWEVVELQLLEATTLAIDNIQDFFLLENRDRAYSRQSVMLKAQYDLLDVQTELAKFGINLPQTYIFTVSFPMMVQVLGRPVLVGDVIELPGEVQYDAQLRPVRKWLEVTDTSWATEGYAFNWKPQLFKFYAQPIMPSVEHRDLLGTPGLVNRTVSDDDFLKKVMQNDQGYKASEAIKAEADDKVPQTGSDPANIVSAKPLLGPRGGYDGTDLYVQDALPPDGLTFTEGDALPSSPAEGDYHRQTYTSVPIGIRPADRLLRWDGTRWRVVEENTRKVVESYKPTASRILSSTNKLNPDTTV